LGLVPRHVVDVLRARLRESRTLPTSPPPRGGLTSSLTVLSAETAFTANVTFDATVNFRRVVIRPRTRAGASISVSTHRNNGYTHVMAHQDDIATTQHLWLRTMILERELPPGTVLLETPLSVRLGVSRTPIREALARLAQEGLITRRTRGYTVRELSPEEIIEVFEARIVLERAIAEQAAVSATELQLARLERVTNQLDQLIAALWTAGDDEDANAWIRSGIGPLNITWHQALRACANHHTLTRLLEQVLDTEKIYNPPMQQHNTEEIALGHRQHHEIVAALHRREPATAGDVMARHLQTVRSSKLAEIRARPGSPALQR
jgi:DNA-binding GntR family transcriptional regulator